VGAGILVAALAGLVVPGPLSGRQAKSPDGSLEVGYNRYVRYHATTSLEVVIHVTDSDVEELDLHLNQEFIDSVEVHRIQPEPVESSLDENGTRWKFKRQGRAKQLRVRIHFEPGALGSVQGAVHLAHRGGVTFHQFVYP
jgi:hypothetical protein